MFEATPSRSAGVASFRRQVEAKPRAVNGSSGLYAERASQPWPITPSLHRPLLLIPRHLPKHPLIARADDEGFFHPPLFFFSRRLGPLIHFLAHPLLDLGEFRRGVEHEPVSIGVIIFWWAMLQEMLADDTVDPGAGEGDDGDLRC